MFSQCRYSTETPVSVSFVEEIAHALTAVTEPFESVSGDAHIKMHIHIYIHIYRNNEFRYSDTYNVKKAVVN